MTELLPISCVSCRRKKIKCNKLKPCNQCVRRSIRCEFPSTFRNIRINEEDLDSPAMSDHDHQGSSYDQIEMLRQEKQELLQENIKLKKSNYMMNNYWSRVKQNETYSEEPKAMIKPPHDESSTKFNKDPIQISGETSETGEKYYGPLSSSFMIEQLRSHGSASDAIAPNTKKMKTEKIAEFDSKSSNHSFDSAVLEQSLSKKSLPMIILQDEDAYSNSPTEQDLYKRNLEVITRLAELFFDTSSYHKTFISKQSTLEFLKQYDSIKDKEWENDDDLLLLYIILIISIQKLTPKELVALNLINRNTKNHQKFKNFMTKNVLYHAFEKLRHNLIDESIITIESYILCVEWYFIEQRYEECWSMMFHACSIAYSIGLHVMGQFKTESGGNKEEDAKEDVVKYKVWFALKNLSGQICSILGRPNPISIQVNQLVLKSSTATSTVDLEKERTQVLLKIGVSECLRLSNLMLIENFMIDFTITDLLNLDAKFENEIQILESFIGSPDEIEESGGKSLKTMDSDYFDINSYKIDKYNAVIDLIILYINRAKLFEPFIKKFEDSKEYTVIVQSLISSIIRFLELIDTFVNSFLKSFFDKYMNDDFISEVRLGKLFRIYFPFLNSFIFQGIVVIFTFLNYKFKEFVNNDGLTSIIFLKSLEQKVIDLLAIDKKITNYKSVASLWSSNIVSLLNRIKDHIRLIFTKQRIQNDIESKQSSNANDNQIPITENNSTYSNDYEYYQLNMIDPFWMTNPEGLPFYLSSPSEDDSSGHVGASKNESGNIISDVPLENQQMGMNNQAELFNLNTYHDSSFNTIWDRSQNANPEQSHQVRQQPQSENSNPTQDNYMMQNHYMFNPHASNMNFPQHSNGKDSFYSEENQDPESK